MSSKECEAWRWPKTPSANHPQRVRWSSPVFDVNQQSGPQSSSTMLPKTLCSSCLLRPCRVIRNAADKQISCFAAHACIIHAEMSHPERWKQTCFAADMLCSSCLILAETSHPERRPPAPPCQRAHPEHPRTHHGMSTSTSGMPSAGTTLSTSTCTGTGSGACSWEAGC